MRSEEVNIVTKFTSEGDVKAQEAVDKLNSKTKDLGSSTKNLGGAFRDAQEAANGNVQSLGKLLMGFAGPGGLIALAGAAAAGLFALGKHFYDLNKKASELRMPIGEIKNFTDQMVKLAQEQEKVRLGLSEWSRGTKDILAATGTNNANDAGRKIQASFRSGDISEDKRDQLLFQLYGVSSRTELNKQIDELDKEVMERRGKNASFQVKDQYKGADPTKLRSVRTDVQQRYYDEWKKLQDDKAEIIDKVNGEAVTANKKSADERLKAEEAAAIAAGKAWTKAYTTSLDDVVERQKEIQEMLKSPLGSAEEIFSKIPEPKLDISLGVWGEFYETLKKYDQDWKGSMAETIDSLGSHFASFVTTGKLHFKSLISELLASASKLAMNKLFKQILGSVIGDDPSTGGITGAIMSFGKGLLGFAGGGRPPVGRPSVIGEKGPELWVPDSAGTIIPNHAKGASYNMSVTIGSVDSSERSMTLIRTISEMIDQKQSKLLASQMRPGGALRR